MFDAYVSLRKIAQKYGLEEKLAIPRVVFVGETSSGKSMRVILCITKKDHYG